MTPAATITATTGIQIRTVPISMTSITVGRMAITSASKMVPNGPNLATFRSAGNREKAAPNDRRRNFHTLERIKYHLSIGWDAFAISMSIACLIL
jgi:hypothetical protein